MQYFTPTKISENIHETPEGFLVCLGVPIARTGDMIYDKSEVPLDPDDTGKLTITREEAEVFRPETIASFEGKPLTITHPKEFVGPHNWKDLAKGIVQNVRRGDGDFSDSLIADLLVTDQVAIGLVRNGLREVSCGYEADWLQEDNEEGTGKQVNIIGNHLALVDQGRAGPSYAINDSKGAGKMKATQDKIKAIFAKAQDDALKLVATDAEMSKQVPATGQPAEAKDAYDEMKKSIDAIGKMVGDLAGKMNVISGDASEKKKEEKASDEDKEKEKADDDQGEATIESRMMACEAAVAQILQAIEGKTGDADKDKEKVDDEDDEVEDEDMEDDDFEKSTMAGDSIFKANDVMSRAEILSPGIKEGKDVKVRALKSAWGTKEGKRVLLSINGGRAPAFDSKEKIETLFTAASELLKDSRQKEFAKTKAARESIGDSGTQPMTADRMNEVNAKFYKRA